MDKIEELRKSLVLTEEPEEGFEKRFEKIAKNLFNNFIIKTSYGDFRFEDIEFYFHSKNHPEVTTVASPSSILKQRVVFPLPKCSSSQCLQLQIQMGQSNVFTAPNRSDREPHSPATPHPGQEAPWCLGGRCSCRVLYPGTLLPLYSILNRPQGKFTLPKLKLISPIIVN